MSTRIDYDETTAFGQQIAEFMATLADAKNRSANLKAAFDAMAAGGSFAQIEAEVGGMKPGAGETLYNIATGINAKLSGNTFDDIWRLYRG